MDQKDLSYQQKIWIWCRTFIRSAKPLLVYLVMPALTMSVGYVILHPDMSAQEFFTYGGNFYTALGMVLALCVLYRSSRKKGHRFFEDATLYPDRATLPKSLGFLAFGASAAVFVSAVLTLLPRWGLMEGYTASSELMYKGPDILFTVITTVLTAPLLEEIVFRGYMLNAFLERYSERTAMLTVSIFFALCHGDPVWFLYAAVMGYLLCWVSVREDNIFYGILMHIGFNAPSGITWMIRSFPEASALFFGNRLLIFGYGLAGGLAALVLARKYLSEKEN